MINRVPIIASTVDSINKLLFPYQKYIFLSLILVYVLSTLIFYSLNLVFNNEKAGTSLTEIQLSNCTTKFCSTLKLVSGNPKNLLFTSTVIFQHNLKADGFLFYYTYTKPKYFLYLPYYDIYRQGNFFGYSLYSNPKNFITQVLLPHGIVEIVSIVLPLSLSYAVLLNLIRNFKNIKFSLPVVKKIGLQLIFSIILVYFAALLESLGVYLKSTT